MLWFLGHLGQFTLSPREDDNASCLWFRLLWMRESSSYNEVGCRVVTQLAGENRSCALLLHQLVRVEHLEGVLVYDQQRENLLFLTILSLDIGLT